MPTVVTQQPEYTDYRITDSCDMLRPDSYCIFGPTLPFCSFAHLHNGVHSASVASYKSSIDSSFPGHLFQEAQPHHLLNI